MTYDFWNTLIGEHHSPSDQRVDRVMVALASVEADVAREALLAATAAAGDFYEVRCREIRSFNPVHWSA